MEVAAGILAAWLIALIMTAVPAFMPPTWTGMTFMVVQFELPLLPVTIGGGIMGAFGRSFVYWLSTRSQRFLVGSRREDAEALGRVLSRHGPALAGATFAYSLAPLPTNNLFIAGGLARVDLRWMLVGYMPARVVAETTWVWIAVRTVENVTDVMSSEQLGGVAILLQVLGLASMVLILRLPWRKWLAPLNHDSAKNAAETESERSETR